MCLGISQLFTVLLVTFPSLIQLIKVDEEHTNPKTQRASRSLVLPRNVWLVLSVPLFAFQASKQELESSQPELDALARENRSLLFRSHGLTWMAILKDTTINISASLDVCVDNFLVRPLVHSDGHNQTLYQESCSRGLTWRDPHTGQARRVLLDSTGADASFRPINSVREMQNEHFELDLIENSTFIGRSRWFRVTGTFILAICATFLFLLFSITLCVSIALTRGKRCKSPSRAIAISPSRTVNSGSRTRVFRPPDYAEDSLLPRIQKSKTAEEETQSFGTEPVSTENGESLFQHDANTCRSLVAEDGDTEVMDPMATSAMQLARNWFLYRNRGDRLRQRTMIGHPSLTNPPVVIPHPPASPLTATASSPYALLKHPTDKVCMPSFVETQASRDFKPTVPSSTNFRHSLVLSVDDHDQLIILPSTQSITSSMHRTGTTGANSSIHEVPEGESDTEGNLTSNEHNSLPTMHQRSRLRTIDGSSQSDTSRHLECDG
ncbi:unnamed protein product [Echinostoma caproni]|uniref:Transmembrane protein n=1 Tax=Echinostoma caproni TaxID=27848 RepID=A0A183AUB7_9TREM|nr:unnamed protein product [Echinostoma caproni]